MDISTILGLLSALGLIVVGITSGGNGFAGLMLFIDVKSLLIVGGGTLGATLINYPLGMVLGSLSVLKNAFFSKSEDTAALIKTLVEYAGTARRDGILALQDAAADIKDPFVNKGIQLAIDGMEPQFISQIMDTEIDHIEDRHKKGAEIFMTMGTFAPALGLIGTLIGLVMMLQSMDDPSTIGPSMAVALITTFYGALFANILFIPLSGKLKTKSSDEILVKELVKEGILSIAAGDNPRVLEQKLNAFLQPKLRKSSFD